MPLDGLGAGSCIEAAYAGGGTCETRRGRISCEATPPARRAHVPRDGKAKAGNADGYTSQLVLLVKHLSPYFPTLPSPAVLPHPPCPTWTTSPRASRVLRLPPTCSVLRRRADPGNALGRSISRDEGWDAFGVCCLRGGGEEGKEGGGKENTYPDGVPVSSTRNSGSSVMHTRTTSAASSGPPPPSNAAHHRAGPVPQTTLRASCALTETTRRPRYLV
ncbi:hypothetical protein C8R47DRAFT_1220418 [Mycena vitilis]|nr:hypothetical protein C8R47DRAFT_1220418 [Mycena vitilis]